MSITLSLPTPKKKKRETKQNKTISLKCEQLILAFHCVVFISLQFMAHPFALFIHVV